MSVTRRDFLKKSATTVAVGLAVPPWLAKMVWADNALADNALAASGQTAGRSLVVIQLTGGNDGLNTVVPYSNPIYKSARPVLAHDPNKVLHLTDTVGLSPVMGGMKTLYDRGRLAIVQGAGYPNPNHSHFRSMEIWQTAEPERVGTEGWSGATWTPFGAGGHRRSPASTSAMKPAKR